MHAPALTAERTKLSQVFQYLQALDQLRNPVKTQIDEQLWSMWFRDIPNHDCVEIYKRNDTDNRIDENGPKAAQDDASITGMYAGVVQDDAPQYFLKVRRPVLTDCPEAPASVRDWLKDGWRRVESQAEIIEARAETDEHGNQIMVQFEDDAQRMQQYEHWLASRDSWLERERPSRLVMAIFEKLYSLHNQMERESGTVDLMLGDGVLSWNPDGGKPIHHPLLLHHVELSFDASIPEFTVSDSDREPELYMALLRTIPDLQASAVSELLTDLGEHTYHPLGSNDTSEFLKRIVTRISPYGELTETRTALRDRTSPKILRDPLLFLRKRTLGYGVALQRILEDLKLGGRLPDSILNLVGVETGDEDRASWDKNVPFDVNGEDERVLLSKEANAEQLEIALRLEKTGAVLVQGPPGTGKTHTIANLLGHLLAQGKSVLVTSHTAKALRVLRDKVVAPLQPLCVSVLANDSESRKQMEHSVDAIAERLSSLDADTLDGQAASLTRQRTKLLAELKELKDALQFARQDEYRPIVVAGESYEPSQAARLVSNEQWQNAWIPGTVELGAPMPLSAAEIAELYASNAQLPAEAEQELHLHLPPEDVFMAPAEFEKLAANKSQLCSGNIAYGDEYWKDVPETQTIKALEELSAKSSAAAELLRDDAPWKMSAISAGKENGELRKVWDDFIHEIEVANEQSVRSQPYFLKHDFDISPELDLEVASKTVEELIHYVKSNGKLGSLKLFTKREWKRLIQNTKVDGHAPSTQEHFETLCASIQLQILRNKLKARWNRHMTELGGPSVESLGDRPEAVAYQFIQPIQQALEWHAKEWLPLLSALKSQGLQIDSVLAEEPEVLVPNAEFVRIRNALTTTLPRVLQAQVNRVIWNQTEKQLVALKRVASEALRIAGNSTIVQTIKAALSEMDAEGYAKAYSDLAHLHQLSNIAKRRSGLLQKLAQVAPAWAAAIQSRSGAHGMSMAPGDPNQAWLWKQLEGELDARGRTSMEELRNKIFNRSQKLREITSSLVEKKAWSAQVKRTTLAQRQALQGWKLLIQKAGKGTGVRAPRLFAEARKLMPVCQTAVPVWIMPLSRVVENFVPGKNQFDVVIIDEASQADVMALTGLYFGNTVLVVGDDEQVSPDAVGQRADETQRLIDTYLTDIPNASIYDGKSSIYDLAKTSFPEVQLREHFRCVAPIIQFSNHLSYGGGIKPLRDDSQVLRRPPTVAYFVPGATSHEKTNEKEALAVASLLIAATEHAAYRDATFGVISLVGDDQAMRVDSLLRRHLPATEYQKRMIRCGNSAQFQGDERDVMFLSVVYGPTGDGPLRMLADPNHSMRKRFNVAASRARDQMWVVHSVDPYIDLKEGDLRKRLILHARDPYQYDEQLAGLEKRTESEFEKLVLRRLMDAGYRVTPQWIVGSYRIDMVVEGGGKRLAVECDGDRWHPHEKLADDMARQAILERLGWQFVRIRGSQFFRNPDHAMEPVFSRLQALEIPAEGFLDQSHGGADALGIEIREWVIRRAEDIQREWAEEEQDKGADVTNGARR